MASLTAPYAGVHSSLLLHQNIQTIKTCCQEAIGFDERASEIALEKLGIDQEDVKAKVSMRSKLVEVISPQAVFIASSNPGVFFVFNIEENEEKKAKLTQITRAVKSDTLPDLIKENESLEPVAVFKVGSKRALMELTLRKIALYLGLEDYTIEGAFFAAESLTIGEDLEEDLHNGMVKEYENAQNKEHHLVGILEPFIKYKSCSHEKKKEFFNHLILLCLAAGVRDVHTDNYLRQLFDGEEIMPERIAPPEGVEKASAATHLPCLESSLACEDIGKHLLAALKKRVAAWDPKALTEKLSKLPVIFADSIAEFSSEDAHILDHGACKVVIRRVEEDLSAVRDERLYTPTFLKKEGETPVFNPSQLKTFEERVSKLKEIFEKPRKRLTPFSIAGEMDPFFKRNVELEQEVQRITTVAHLESSLKRAEDGLGIKRQLSRSLSSEGVSKYHRSGSLNTVPITPDGTVSVFDLVGRVPAPTGLMSPVPITLLARQISDDRDKELEEMRHIVDHVSNSDEESQNLSPTENGAIKSLPMQVDSQLGEDEDGSSLTGSSVSSSSESDSDSD
jgi:hypothetical protein